MPLLVEALGGAPGVERRVEPVELCTKRLLVELRLLVVQILVGDAIEDLGEDGESDEQLDQLVRASPPGRAQEQGHGRQCLPVGPEPDLGAPARPRRHPLERIRDGDLLDLDALRPCRLQQRLLELRPGQHRASESVLDRPARRRPLEGEAEHLAVSAARPPAGDQDRGDRLVRVERERALGHERAGALGGHRQRAVAETGERLGGERRDGRRRGNAQRPQERAPALRLRDQRHELRDRARRAGLVERRRDQTRREQLELRRILDARGVAHERPDRTPHAVAELPALLLAQRPKHPATLTGSPDGTQSGRFRGFRP